MEACPLEPPVPHLSDGVVELRPWSPSDIPAILAACQDPEIPRWTRVPDSFGEEDAREWLATHQPKMRAGEGLPLAVVAPAGQVLGAIELHIHRHGVADIGYWVAPWARRRRVATRALVLLSRWAFATLPLFRLQVTTDPANIASQAVAERAGFRREGLLRSYVEIKGRRMDRIMYARLPMDAD
jgi:RimJ/RimL family protein N-acetyltransferase